MTVPFTHLAFHSFLMFIIGYMGMGRSQKVPGNKENSHGYATKFK